MTSGIDFAWFGDEPVPGPDLAQTMLGRPSRGRVFQYSDASPYVAMRMLAAAVGDVRDWLLLASSRRSASTTRSGTAARSDSSWAAAA
ncbi:hypothetical protein [Clavibacter tessellarius]|uniref:hypothetical protein n=1 Tax=Clavibacter tessellarius TaxID=31965 RepID=UPI003256371D